MKAKERLALIPLSLEEVTLIGTALSAYHDACRYALVVGYNGMTRKGRNRVDDEGIKAVMLRGELYARLEKATGKLV